MIQFGDHSGMETKFEDLDKTEHSVFGLSKHRYQLSGIILETRVTTYAGYLERVDPF